MKFNVKNFLICITIILAGCAISRQAPLFQNIQKVNGKLEGDTFWEGIIEVEDKIIVPEDMTLTIKPGTIVRFQKRGFKQFGFGDNRIYVQKGGKLIAEGSPGNYIVFTSREKNPQAGDWHGIEFHSEDNSGILKYCKIEYAYEAVVCVLSSPLISNTIISKNDKGICLWQKSSPEINANKISDNKTAVICSSKSSPYIVSNVITNNSDCGINCEKGSNSTIFKNVIVNNNYGIKNNLDALANIDNNIIKKNNYGIHQLTVFAGIITGNIIEENKYGIFSLRRSVMNVNNNSISRNEYGIFTWERTEGKVTNNDIVKNKFGIYCGRSSNIEILKNEISKNTIGILCEFSSYPRINGNNICNQSGYDVKLGENQSFEWTKNIWKKEEIKIREENGGFDLVNANGNFWGEWTTKEMDKKGFGFPVKKIYDYFSEQFCKIEGKDYTRDKVDFRKWENKEIMEAGKK
ncbi:MAG: right-handed parallel beta-helix repeat-containing protein [bacterium]